MYSLQIKARVRWAPRPVGARGGADERRQDGVRGGGGGPGARPPATRYLHHPAQGAVRRPLWGLQQAGRVQFSASEGGGRLKVPLGDRTFGGGVVGGDNPPASRLEVGVKVFIQRTRHSSFHELMKILTCSSPFYVPIKSPGQLFCLRATSFCKVHPV